MAIDLPIIGQPNWGEPLNAVLRELDSRVGVPGKDGEPGPKGDTGDVTPAAIAARDAAVAARDQAEVFSAATQTLQDEAVADIVSNQASKSSRKVAAASVRASGSVVSLLEWVGEGVLPNTENADCTPLFTQVMDDLRAMSEVDGQIHTVLVPAGRYRFESRLTPPNGGRFGIRGAGMHSTTFLTAASNSWIGMNQFQVGDPDFQWADMVFEDFTVDGSRQPVGTTYVSGLKGFIMHNFRDTRFSRVRVKDTHATGFGIDYSDNVWFTECVADGAGRGRKVHDANPETRFGSGSGFGIGFGQKQDEAIFITNSVARNCGASGIFGEQLAQPEAINRAVGLFVSNTLVEKNAIGMNDTGTRGTQVSGLVARHNTYAGYRVGISNASEQGGIDGQVRGLTAYGNKVGVALEGSSEGSYLFDGVEVFENSRAGVEWRATGEAWPAPNMRLRGLHSHHNGGPGVLGETVLPIVQPEITDMLVHDNKGQGLYFKSPLSRPRFTGRVFGNTGFAASFAGGAVMESPVIALDVHGSAGGGLKNLMTVDGTSDIRVAGNPATVVQSVTRPVPDPALTGWIGQSVTLTYDGAHPDGIFALGVATDKSPRIIGPDVSVSPTQILTASAVVLAPAGKSVRCAVRYGSGGSPTWVGGPVVRTTGVPQRVHFTVAVPVGQSVVRVGVMGAAGTSAWAVGDQLRVTRANLTVGGQLWPYIDGGRPNCAWDGAIGASTSTLTIPTSEAAAGFSDDFKRADGPVGLTPGMKPWSSATNAGAPVPLVIQGQLAKAGPDAGAARSLWVVEGDSGDGVFEAEIADVGEHWTGFVLRVTDAQNFIVLSWCRNSTVPTYKLAKRVDNTETELTAALPSVGSASGDVVRVTLAGQSVTVEVNGSVIFGGPVTIPEHASATKHGWMLVKDQVSRAESLRSIKFTPSA